MSSCVKLRADDTDELTILYCICPNITPGVICFGLLGSVFISSKFSVHATSREIKRRKKYWCFMCFILSLGLFHRGGAKAQRFVKNAFLCGLCFFASLR